MAEIGTEYGITLARKPEFLLIGLITVPHKDSKLVLSYPAFGPNYFKNNLAKMQESYSDPEGNEITFREPTTSESISAAAYNFEELAKKQIFNPRWLQAGYIVRTSEGVYANPPNDPKGNIITNESQLRALIEKSEKIKVGKGHIYLGENDFGFAPYETFTRNIQYAETFAQGGLARILEHTSEEAHNLKAMASTYTQGVNVWGFDNIQEPVVRVACLNSNRVSGGLGVGGGDWDGDGGCAFGVRRAVPQHCQ